METGQSCAGGIGSPLRRPSGAPTGGPRQPWGTSAARPASCLLAWDTYRALQFPAGACHMFTTRTPERLKVGCREEKKCGRRREGKENEKWKGREEERESRKGRVKGQDGRG